MRDEGRATAAARGPRPGTAFRRRADRWTTAVLFVLLAAGAIALLRAGALVALPADPCDGDLVRCDSGRISAAAIIAADVPSVLLVSAVAVAAIRPHQDRAVCSVPLLGIAATIAVLPGAGTLVDAAITRGP